MVGWIHAGGDQPAAREGLLVSHRSVRIRLAAALAAVILAPLGLLSVSSTVARATTSGPLIRVRAVGLRAATASTNWSGYGLAGYFASVAGSWTVPAASPSVGPTYSSSWVGIDGLANRNLIQAGTESDYVNGYAQYDAWWEILPGAERVVAKLPVSAGDHLSASITHTTGKKWTIALVDATSGRSFTYTRSYRGLGASAEWIEERPQIGHTLSVLAAYGSTTFSSLTANGANPHLTSAGAISMVGDVGNRLISVPSVPSVLGDAFSVAYGASAPPPPAG